MKKFLLRFLEPLNSIKNQSYHFASWWIFTNILGLAGFWIPLIILLFNPDKSKLNFSTKSLIDSGMLSSFSIIILAEGVAAALVAVKGGSNMIAAGIRGIAGVIALIVVAIQVTILVILTIFDYSGTKASNTATGISIIITILSICLATYLYCFRYPDWEKGVAEVVQSENEDVEKIRDHAKIQTNDEGVKL